MKNILLFLLIFNAPFSFSQQTYDFAIYHDGDIGAWEEDVIAFEHFLDWKGVSHKRVGAQEINTAPLKDSYGAIFFPGGDADYYSADINATGIQHIRDLVFTGGAYIGMCAGAEFASDKLVWEGFEIDYPLNFFQGKSIGPIDQLAIWPDYAMTSVSMNPNDEINSFGDEQEDMLYWGGSVFHPYADTPIDTVATFDGFANKPAIIKFYYGNGRVLLISPHPEIEEDSNRDGVNVAEELDDNGSDWGFLWTATDWLLGNPLSEPTALHSPAQGQPHFKLFPNPVHKSLNISPKDEIISVKFYDWSGRLLLNSKNPTFPIDLSFLPNGVYSCQIETQHMQTIEKVVIANQP